MLCLICTLAYPADIFNSPKKPITGGEPKNIEQGSKNNEGNILAIGICYLLFVKWGIGLMQNFPDSPPGPLSML